MELPTKKSEPEVTEPRFLIMFGKPKCGKTSVLAQLPNNLIIDLEGGTKMFESLNVQVDSFNDLEEVAAAIKKAECPYDFITIDTATKLEEIILPYAQRMYNNSPQGKNYGWNKDTEKYDFKDVRTLPNGSGYYWLREAFKKVLNIFKNLTNHIILTGHVTDVTLERDGTEVNSQEIDLAGKLKRIIPADADSVSYIYRKKQQTILSFKAGEDVTSGSRINYLSEKDIVIAEPDENGNLITYWKQVFPNTLKNT